MTETTYRALSEAAADEITKLSAIGARSEDIVIVATRDVFSTAYTYDPFFFQSYDVRELTVTARFCRYVVGVVNEDTRTMFRAAIRGIRGLYDLQDIEPGTLVVSDDDNQAKVYTVGRFDGLATQLHDIGLTVSFKNNQETMLSAANVAAETAANPLFPSRGNRFRYIEPSFVTEYDYQWLQSPFNLGVWTDINALSRSSLNQLLRQTDARATCSVKNVESEKRAEAKPDTAALDEFLSSFNILASAT